MNKDNYKIRMNKDNYKIRMNKDKLLELYENCINLNKFNKINNIPKRYQCLPKKDIKIK